ncbi:MAG: hypothetical protein K1X54_07180 [Flavobacteriales bacterium]|nr:hypothetical protein [Flavobacteriales bacterium]
MKKTKRVCKNGHSYFKSSDCPTCPICASMSKPADGLLSMLAAPARRALAQANILDAEALSKFTKAEILNLHGMGPSSIPKLEAAMKKMGLTFRQSN